MLNAGHHHTPAELADLRVIRDRTLGALADDVAPIIRTRYEDDGRKVREPMPWREAMELEEDGLC